MAVKLPFTSVVSYHTNPMTCGVAKFSAELAKRLGVRLVSTQDQDQWGDFPLLSFKDTELPSSLHYECLPNQFGVFWHDGGRRQITDRASIVFYADPSLGSPGLWCPSLINVPRRIVRLFAFGMVSKIQHHQYRRVRELLERAGLEFHLRISVGIHEGTSLSDATHHFDAIKEILGPSRVTVLGCLSDEAVAEELHRADCVVAFFKDGLRANNTTVHAAIQSGVPILSNPDEQTTYPLNSYVFDVNTVANWPLLASPCESVYTWHGLLYEMERIYAQSTDRQPTHQR